MGPRLKALALIWLVGLAALQPLWASDCTEEYDRLRQPAHSAIRPEATLRWQVQTLTETLRDLALKDGCSLQGAFCRGASGTLAYLLKKRFGTPTEPVINEGLHTLLRIPDFYGPGKPVYIDPTVHQFISPEHAADTELVFVGDSRALMDFLERKGVAPEVRANYLRGLDIDTVVPLFTGTEQRALPAD